MDTGARQNARREELSRTDDTRVLRTRQRLLAALGAELARGDAADLSVGHIATQAGISRATFYTHFASIEDLAAFGLADFYASLSVDDETLRTEARLPQREIVHGSIRRLVDHLLHNAGTLGRALVVDEHTQLRDRFFSLIGMSVVRAVAIERPAAPQQYAHRIGRMLAVGVGTAIIDWLREGRPEPVEELVETILDVLPDWLANPRPRA